MARIRVTGKCEKVSSDERGLYPRDLAICESLERLAGRLGANIKHIEIEHNENHIYKNIYIVYIGAKDWVSA